jgi:hypothetical protein
VEGTVCKVVTGQNSDAICYGLPGYEGMKTNSWLSAVKERMHPTVIGGHSLLRWFCNLRLKMY